MEDENYNKYYFWPLWYENRNQQYEEIWKIYKYVKTKQ